MKAHGCAVKINYGAAYFLKQRGQVCRAGCGRPNAMIYTTVRLSRAYDAGTTGDRGLRTLRVLRTPVNHKPEPPALCGRGGRFVAVVVKCHKYRFFSKLFHEQATC